MTFTNSAQEIFADARQLYDAAIERLEAGDVRDAAEKAWCATKRATDGLIVARGGYEPERSPITTLELRKLALVDPSIERLKAGYYSRQNVLHGECFYIGLCEPLEDTERQIRETTHYISEAMDLAHCS